jgi:eukaryotic-like serine/threonine-protein kinase
VRVIESSTRFSWSPPGYVLFVRENTLFAQRMNCSTFQLEGHPIAIAEEVTASAISGRNTVAVSRNGVLSYRTGLRSEIRQLSWRDRAGKVLSSVGPAGEHYSVTLSPDEKRVALIVGDSESPDIQVMDLATGVLTSLNFRSAYRPVWSPDSRRLAAHRSGDRIEEIHVDSGKTSLLAKGAYQTLAWSPDARFILALEDGSSKMSLLGVGGNKPEPLPETAIRPSMARFSPDGRHVAYVSRESQPQLYVASFPSFAVKRQVTTRGGLYPEWGKGGKELYYRSSDGMLMVAEVRSGSTIEVGVPKPLFKFGAGNRGNQFGVSGDGRFLIDEFIHADELDKPEFVVMLNWTDALKGN